MQSIYITQVHVANWSRAGTRWTKAGVHTSWATDSTVTVGRSVGRWSVPVPITHTHGNTGRRLGLGALAMAPCGLAGHGLAVGGAGGHVRGHRLAQVGRLVGRRRRYRTTRTDRY
jgi:hypothetical protein